MKDAYLWVVNWGKTSYSPTTSAVSADLFFSSKEVFQKLLGWRDKERMDKEQLVLIQVPDDFEDLDYIPNDY